MNHVIDNDYAKETCKFGQGEATCAYLTMNADGWGCAKGTPTAATIQQRLTAGTMGAAGDNCDGWELLQLKQAFGADVAIDLSGLTSAPPGSVGHMLAVREWFNRRQAELRAAVEQETGEHPDG